MSTEFGPQQPDYSQSNEPASLQGKDFGDRTTWVNVSRIVYELERWNVPGAATQILGIPADTPWETIDTYMNEELRKYLARDFGLPDDAPWEDVEVGLDQEEAEMTRRRIEKLGLPEDATQSDIYKAEHARRAQFLELPENVSDHEIWEAEITARERAIYDELRIDPGHKPRLEEILSRAFGFPSNLNTDAVIEKIRENREHRIQSLLQEAQELNLL